MSEQQIITADETASNPSPAASVVLPGEKLGRLEGQPPDKKQHERKYARAPERIRELLSEVKFLKQRLLEAKQMIDLAEQDKEKLRGELFNLTQENDVLRGREEDRLFKADEEQRAAQQEGRQKAEEYFTLCLAAVINAAKDTGAYARHPDFDSRLRRADYLRAPILEIALQFPKHIAPELVYALACDETTYKKLASLPPATILFQLSKVAERLNDQFKLDNLLR
jgi:hypothetical protein